MVPTDRARGPWSPDALHGGPVAALVARSAERHGENRDDALQLARITLELLRPVPLAPLTLRTSLVKPGRKVQLLDVVVVAGEVEVAKARVLRLRVDPDQPVVPVSTPEDDPPDPPERCAQRPPMVDRYVAFHNHGVDMRFVAGRAAGRRDDLGPAVVWFRLQCPVVLGEEPTPWQRAAAVADFGNGVSSELDFFDQQLHQRRPHPVHPPPPGRGVGMPRCSYPVRIRRHRRRRVGDMGCPRPHRASTPEPGGRGQVVSEVRPRGEADSVAGLLARRAEDDHPGLRFEDEQWTWREVVDASARRASWIRSLGGAGPVHIGVLLGNVPEYLFWLGAAALAGGVVVGINPTRRGEALAGDIRRTDCRLIVTDAEGRHGSVASSSGYPTEYSGSTIPPTPGGWPPTGGPSPVAARLLRAEDLFLLLFTSGTTGSPKAVRCTQGRLASIATYAAGAYGFGRDDVAYCTMPLFHGNALMVLWGPSLVVGATVALARRFSASGFLADVRRHRATTFTYVGKALAYVLATPPGEDDATTTLRRGFGTEASVADQVEFERRFGCVLTEGYGSSEGGVAISRTPGTPVGSLGRPADGVAILDPETLEECPVAQLDAAGRLCNAAEAIGEIVNRAGIGSFEGYYGDPAATVARTRHGWYWTGDLAYRDADGYYYFAGRGGDWMRVDSENLTAGPVERILSRQDGVAAAAVYPVADPRSGDQVMAAVELLPGRSFDAAALGRFLAAQPDLGTKWAPSFVRVAGALPQTASGKVTKERLRAEGWWEGGDPIFRRVGSGLSFQLMDDRDRDALRAEFRRHGREGLVGG